MDTAASTAPTAWPTTGPTTSGRLRLETLILARWLAIAGQTGAALFVEFVLRLNLNLGAALAVIAASAWFNLFLMVARPTQGPVPMWEAFGQLAYDAAQLALLVGLTGGAANPFLLLLIAPVAIAASVLSPRMTGALALFALLCVAALLIWRAPLPWRADAPLALPRLYEIGLAVAVATGLLFTTLFARTVAAEEARMTLALTATEAVLAREQRLSALGGLAAAAAHELGTPLATIHLVAKEMARALPADSPFAEDASVLVSQAERCRAILQQLAVKPEEGDAMMARAALPALIEEIVGPHRGLGADIVITIQGPPDAPVPTLRRAPDILHALTSLIENAVGFAQARVEINARWNAQEIAITVRDDGPGFSSDVLPRLGAPYLSSSARDRPGGGLGLGFFIAKTLLERSGARVEARNRTLPRTGAVVTVAWPRAAVEAPA